AELNKFTPAQLKTLDNLVAFEKGAGKTLYFVTDPMCPYCKKAERILEPLMEEGKIKVKFLLFPLRFHKGAKEQCISIICDKKGLEGLKTQYRSENQCEAGKRQVEDTVKFLQQKGITGTPTYIFMDGRYHSGVLQKDALLKRLGVK
ncbi:MAG TPA: DsbC family protein, partial [Dissulfuribacter thermophilus]|nr:DsbC family protein [Dissulfuribacter thermophilus]